MPDPNQTDPKSTDERAKRLMADHKPIWQEVEQMRSVEERLARYVMPRKSELQAGVIGDGPDDSQQSYLYDGTMISANQILASGQASMVVPATKKWMEFEAPRPLRADSEISRWMQDCTEATLEGFGSSNFYTEIQECLLNRSGLAKCCLFIDNQAGQPISFVSLPVGSFGFKEGRNGEVETLHREFQKTAEWARDTFGEDALPPSMREALGNPEASTKMFTIVHIVRPRMGRDDRRVDNLNMPFESFYLEKAEEHLLEESGYEEMPFIVSRYLKWVGPGDNSQLAWCPSFQAISDMRQLNRGEQVLDLTAEMMVNPPVLVPQSLDHAVDFSPLGKTVYNDGSGSQSKPELWDMSGMRYDVGKDRSEDKRDRIRSAFHVDLFQMFQGIDRETTATEVNAREAEKLMQFSPAFTRLASEFLKPILRVVFAMKLRRGELPPVPAALIQQQAGGVFLPDPETVFHNAITLAHKVLENAATYEHLQWALSISEVQPDIWDNYDLDTVAAMLASNSGVPTAILRKPEEIEAIRQARAERQEAMQQAEMLKTGADAANKLGMNADDVGELAAVA